jgi:SAM-dependent methyltransferase
VPSGHILDAGCGAGTLTELLARRGYRVTAVEGSPKFVEYVRDRVARAGLASRVEVRLGDLEHAELASDAFDGAVCGEVLEHLADDGAAARGIAGALKPGGALALSVPARPDRYSGIDRWAGHYRRYDEEGLRSLLVQAGLSVERLIQWGFPFMALYERFVQRPGLARAAGGRPLGRAIGQAARSAPVERALATLFNIDRLFEGRVADGPGFFAVARKP